MNFSAVSDRTFLGRALRLPLKLMIPDHGQMRILQGPLRGKKWIAGSANHGCWLGCYEYPKQRTFSRVIKSRDVVYDLGANVGFYSLLASVLVGPEGRVFSFEPVPRNLRFLRDHIALNQFGNCTVLDVAVSSSDGVANFEFGQSSSMGKIAGQGSEETTQIRTVALDRLVASGELPPPNVIKCDIEGAEFDALVGASTILARHAPTIFLATHGSEVHEHCLKLLTDLHYQLTPLDELPLEETREILAICRKGSIAI